MGEGTSLMNDQFTVIVARRSSGAVRKYQLSKRFLWMAAIPLLVLLVSSVLASLHYYYMFTRSRDYVALKTEVDQLRQQNEGFQLTARQMTDRLSSIEVAAQKLRIVSGLDDAGLGGVGGPSDTSAILNLDEKSLDKHFRSLSRRSINIANDLRKLQEYYKDKSILFAATPSILPVNGYPSDSYGMRSDPFTGGRDFHPGMDISAPYGHKVVATADGTVEFSGRQVAYGKLVVIDHRFGLSTRYGHLQRIAVTNGQKVRKGDIIGYVGSTGRATGPHVHYEVRLNGQTLDPSRFLGGLE